MFDTGQSWWKLFCLALTILSTFLSCQISARPVLTGITGGVANEGYPASNNDDTYLKFRPRTQLFGIQTEDKIPEALLQGAKENTPTDDVNDKQNLQSNVLSNVLNDMQIGYVDGNEVNVPSNKEHSFVEQDSEDGKYQNIGEGKEQGFGGDLNNDDVISEDLPNETRNKKLNLGSNVASIADDTEKMLHEVIARDEDVSDRIISNEGDLKDEKGSETVKPETSTGPIEDNDGDSAEEEQPDDIDDVLNTLEQMIGSGLDEEDNDRVVTGMKTVYPDGNLGNEGRRLREIFHEQPSNSEPQEMTQNTASKENTTDDVHKSAYPSLSAIFRLSQVEDNGIMGLHNISDNIISDVESLTRPFLQIMEDVLTNDNNDISNNKERYVYDDGPTLSTEENNGKRDDSTDFPLQTINEIEIIYSF